MAAIEDLEYSDESSDSYDDDQSPDNVFYHYAQTNSEASRLVADHLSKKVGSFKNANGVPCEWREWCKESDIDRELRRKAKSDVKANKSDYADVKNEKQHNESTSDLVYRLQLVENVKFFWLRKRLMFPFGYHKRLHGAQHRYKAIMVNHTCGELHLTQKAMLVRSLADYYGEQGYFRVHPDTYIFTPPSRVTQRPTNKLNLETILSKLAPDLDQLYHNSANSNTLWIFKPSTGSCGRGIKILDLVPDPSASREDFEHNIKENIQQLCRAFANEKSLEVIGQRYISNPYLYQGCKFDLRVYLLIASIKQPFFALLSSEGYLRICSDLYDTNFSNKNAHITNFHVQRDHPLYDAATDSVEGRATRVEYSLFIEYLFQHNYINTLTEEERKAFLHDNEVPIEASEVKALLRRVLKSRMHYCVGNAVRSAVTKIQNHNFAVPGQFAILGVDLLLDMIGNIWLIEFTKSPAYRMQPDYLLQLHTGVLSQSADIVIDVENAREEGLTGFVNDIQNLPAVKNSSSWDVLLEV